MHHAVVQLIDKLVANILRGHDHSPQKAVEEGRERNLHQRGGQGQVGQS